MAAIVKCLSKLKKTSTAFLEEWVLQHSQVLSVVLDLFIYLDTLDFIGNIDHKN